MNTNFQEETVQLIGSHVINEFYFTYNENLFTNSDTIYTGKDLVDWGKMPDTQLNYDNGYGLQYWRGWITFKDTPDWLVREEYDGSEWWSWITRPSLEKENKVKQ